MTTEPMSAESKPLTHPGTWLPGDQVEGASVWTRDRNDWVNEFGSRVNDDRMSRWVEGREVRIAHLVPREPEPADAPPVLPDVSGWVRAEDGQPLPKGTPFVAYAPEGRKHYEIIPDAEVVTLIPPPAEPEPVPEWTTISADPENPTLAKVTFEYEDGKEGHDVTDAWIIREGVLVSGHHGMWSDLGHVASVEPVSVAGPDDVVGVVVREAQAEALREAADAIAELADFYPEDVWPPFGPDDDVRKDRAAAHMARNIYQHAAPSWLRDRAAEILADQFANTEGRSDHE